MGERVVRFTDGSSTRWGVLLQDEVQALPGEYETLAELLLENPMASREPSTSQTFRLEDITLLSPVTRPAQIICQGANYSNHRQEAGMQPERPLYNLIFTKSDSSLCGAFDNVVMPNHVHLLDYEIEVGMVMKKPILQPTRVTSDNFLDFVAGVVIANDVSARDIQLVEGQWYKGKSFRTFCPTGPFLYLFDSAESEVIHDLDLTLSVNGEVRQKANTSQLLFKPEETLTELSQIVDLAVGDLILTGTPGGVALKLTSDELLSISNNSTPADVRMERLLTSQKNRSGYLKAGDEIVAEIRSSDGRIDLGRQQNRVVTL